MTPWEYDSLDYWAYTAYASVPDSLGVGHALLAAGAGSVPLSYVGNHATEWTRRISDTAGLPTSAVRSALFWARAFKKWTIADPSYAAQRREKALSGFLARNAAAQSRPLVEIPYPYDSYMREYLERALPCQGDWMGGNFGPGAIFEKALDLKWRIDRRGRFVRFRTKTHENRYRHLGEWCRIDEHWPEDPHSVPDADHVCARLCAVPKDALKDRLITVEPLYNTWNQQFVRSVLLESIHHGSLRGTAMDQEYRHGDDMQRSLALKASRTKRLATIDLKDASDNITYGNVIQVFPHWVCALLDVTRSTKITDGLTEYPLAIFAGMGNATTFIVETLFFSAFTYAFARAHRLPSFVSVFGDDVICHSRTAQELCERAGEFPWYVPGPEKCFYGADGLREACGIFAYNGVDVTVPHIDGYRPGWAGRCAVADLHARTVDDPTFWGLAHQIACDRVLPNYPFRILGYPSITDWTAEMNAELPTIVYNRDLQRPQVKVDVPDLAIDRVGASWFESQPDLNYGLYQATLCGAIMHSDAMGREAFAFNVGTGKGIDRLKVRGDLEHLTNLPRMAKGRRRWRFIENA